MHIHEAVLAGSPGGIAVLAVGGVATAAGTLIGLRRIDYEHIPPVAVLTAAFFVVSLIHVPLGVTSIHLVLNGLVGLLLGWAAFPALLVALLLQAVMFGHGGLLALGLNTLTMALPAVIGYALFRHGIRSEHDMRAFACAFAAGASAVMLSSVLTAAALWSAGDEFVLFAETVVGFHLAVAVVEGLVTASVVVFLRKVRPELFQSASFVPRCVTELSNA